MIRPLIRCEGLTAEGAAGGDEGAGYAGDKRVAAGPWPDSETGPDVSDTHRLSRGSHGELALKTKERTAVGGGGRTSQTSAGGDRLPVAPRERKPALAALAVLLILVGALGATVLVLRAGDKMQAVEITQRVAAGQSIPASAVEEVDVAAGGSLDYVPWSQRGALGSYRAATDLLPDTPLVGQMLTHGKALSAGQVVVGLSLKAGQYPQGLQPGDHVAAYQVSTDTGSATGGKAAGFGDNVLAADAKVQTAQQPSADDVDSSGDLPVTLVVDRSDAAALTQAASAGEVALVIVPTGSGG